jgi:hypothetical protein
LNNTASGSITGADGSFIQFGSAAATNAGTITMNGAGGTTMLQMGYAGNPGNEPYYQWTNTGTIKVTDTDLRLGGYFTQADIGTVNRSGRHGQLERIPRKHRPDAGHQRELAARRPAHGRWHDPPRHRSRQRRRQPVRHRQQQRLARRRHGARRPRRHRCGYAIAYFTNGLSVKDSSGSNPGVIKVTGDGAYLYSQGTQTLDKATVHLGGTSSRLTSIHGKRHA